MSEKMDINPIIEKCETILNMPDVHVVGSLGESVYNVYKNDERVFWIGGYRLHIDDIEFAQNEYPELTKLYLLVKRKFDANRETMDAENLKKANARLDEFLQKPEPVAQPVEQDVKQAQKKISKLKSLFHSKTRQY